MPDINQNVSCLSSKYKFNFLFFYDTFSSSGIKSSGKADYPMIMTIRLLTEFDKENELLLDRVSRLMNHREERIKEKRDWERVNKRIVQPIMKISDKWKEDDIQNCVGFIR